MLEVRLTKRYFPFKLDISFSINKETYNLILGPSGSGKSLTLRLIAGFERPDNGYIKLNGRDITGFPPERRNIVYLPQNLGLFPHLSVYENIIYTFKAKREKVNKGYVNTIIEKFRIADLLKRRPTSLSGGEAQRVALARALVAKPKILLLDEPLSYLDFHIKFQLMAFLQLLKNEFSPTVIHVTHDPIEAFKLADYLFILEDGRLCFEGDKYDLFNNPPLGFGEKIVKGLKIIESLRG